MLRKDDPGLGLGLNEASQFVSIYLQLDNDTTYNIKLRASVLSNAS
jgi:hypothetical protein